MKKFVYFLLGSFAMAASACSEETTRFVEPDTAFKVVCEVLDFESGGGTQNFSIEAYNATWNIAKEPARGSWRFTKGDTGENRAEIEYTLPANDVEEPYEDYFLIEAPGFEPAKVTVTQKGTVYDPVLVAYPTALYFSAKGGTRAVYVTAEHVAWSIGSEDDWIGIDRTDETDDAGRIKVNISATEWSDPANDRSGKVILAGDGVQTKEIEVFQLAAEPEPQEAANIWERPSRSRMNLKGRVQTVSEHYNFLNFQQISNLQFSSEGMLTAYSRTNMYQHTESHRITYGANGRIERIEGTWNANDRFTLTFTYGSHGKYVSVWELFTKLNESSIDLQHTVWLPHVVLDLERIDLTYHRDADAGGMYSATDGTGEIIWSITGDTGSLAASLDYSWGASTFGQDLAFSGAYPSQVATSDGQITDYSFNAETGYLISAAEYWEGSAPSGSTWYNDDRINSVWKNDSPDEWSGFTTLYDEDLDILEQKFGTEYAGFTASYPEKDIYGNWLKAEIAQPFSTISSERTITYF